MESADGDDVGKEAPSTPPSIDDGAAISVTLPFQRFVSD
jgi:hypothetical protein